MPLPVPPSCPTPVRAAHAVWGARGSSLMNIKVPRRLLQGEIWASAQRSGPCCRQPRSRGPWPRAFVLEPRSLQHADLSNPWTRGRPVTARCACPASLASGPHHTLTLSPGKGDARPFRDSPSFPVTHSCPATVSILTHSRCSHGCRWNFRQLV